MPLQPRRPALPDHQNLAQAYLEARAALQPGAPNRTACAELLAFQQNRAVDWLNLGFEHFSGYRFHQGHGALNEALRRDPRLLAAHWLSFQHPDSVSPSSVAAAQRFAERWQRGLAHFERLDLSEPSVKNQIWGCVGSCTAFYRHYLGDCVDEQFRYGRLLHRMMSTLDRGEPMRPVRDGKRTVLFCSAYWYEHTVARLFAPIVEDIDREHLDVHCLNFGGWNDGVTDRLRAIGNFHDGPRDGPDWRKLVGELRPDVIIYPELGMDPLTLGLAALRLAPVQCALWGHPVTSGLPTIDYFLSPDEVEPENAASHYSERLIRLPGLGHAWRPEVFPRSMSNPKAPSPDAWEGLNLLCAQSIYKLMPEQDALFAQVLARLPEARLHLIPHQTTSVREWLLSRMQPAMAAVGVDAVERVQLHGFRPLHEYCSFADQCDIGLDSIGWSGGMSAFDLVARGLPTVCIEGRSMRGRQTASLLTRLGAPELIARDLDDYVDKVVALARNPLHRRQLRERLKLGVAKLNDQSRVTGAVTDFLRSCSPLTKPSSWAAAP